MNGSSLFCSDIAQPSSLKLVAESLKLLETHLEQMGHQEKRLDPSVEPLLLMTLNICETVSLSTKISSVDLPGFTTLCDVNIFKS